MGDKSGNKRKRIIVIFAMMAVLIVAFVIVWAGRKKEVHHYHVRSDLSIYFTNADEVIDSIRRSLKRHDFRIEISYTSHHDNMEDIPDLVRDLMSFAVAQTDDPTEGDYIYHQYGGYDISYKYKKKGKAYLYTVSIEPHYYTTLEQERAVTQRVQELFGEFGFDDQTSDYEKFRKIYDYVYENVAYDEIHKKNEYYHLKTTAYAALIYRRAVCQGYSVLMYRLLREAGIDTRVITGMVSYGNEEEFHAWNIVKLDGWYYNVDVTWAKQLETEEYLLKCDENFLLHVRDEAYATEEFYEEYPMAAHDYQLP